MKTFVLLLILSALLAVVFSATSPCANPGSSSCNNVGSSTCQQAISSFRTKLYGRWMDDMEIIRYIKAGYNSPPVVTAATVLAYNKNEEDTAGADVEIFQTLEDAEGEIVDRVLSAN